MIERAFCEKLKARCPTYVGVSVCSDWLKFSNFFNWISKQVIYGNELDKDIILPGNKMYSPEFAAMVPEYVNLSFIKPQKRDLPTGVYKRGNRYVSMCYMNGELGYLGYYSTPAEAHQKWQEKKIENFKNLALRYSKEPHVDSRVLSGINLRVSMLEDDLKHGRITENM